MSNEKIVTSLDGYECQLIPNGLDALNKNYHLSSNDSRSLEEIGKIVLGFKEIRRETTEDSYTWFWGLHFDAERGQVAVLFPWCQDWGNQDGLRLDRSIAVYSIGNVETQTVDEIINGLYQGLLIQE
ncbi:MAG: hypothetical protein ABIF40_00910 [archaeon]